MKELSIEQKARNYDEAIERARKEYKDHEAFNSFRNMLVRIFPELSIEQKARNYDEAIERARNEYKNHEAFNSFREIIIRLFPELKESKENNDEETRKALINFLKSPFVNENITDEKVAPWIAWLEKQSKENMIEALQLEYEKGKADALQEKEWTSEDLLNRNEIMDILQEYNRDDLIAWLKDQGKQKPKQYDIDILEKHITKDSISELAHTVMVRNGWEIVDAKEQKLTGWSEWDDKMVKIIDTLLMRASTGAGLGTIRCPYDDARDFIQSLKQRYGWKPSKEQIISLRWVLNNIPYNKYKEEISGLLEQIKNL